VILGKTFAHEILPALKQVAEWTDALADDMTNNPYFLTPTIYSDVFTKVLGGAGVAGVASVLEPVGARNLNVRLVNHKLKGFGAGAKLETNEVTLYLLNGPRVKSSNHP
jgi:hypothetical protein